MQIRENEILKKHTSFRVGGPAGQYYIPENREELKSLIRGLHAEGKPFRILGNGSNVLVSDSGVDFAVIEIRGAMEGIEILSENHLSALAGTKLSKLASVAMEQGLSGMEGLHGIPGTVGGAMVMNAGAYGTEMKDVVESCTVITREGEEKTLSWEELDFSYRHSCIEGEGYAVLSVLFRLNPGKREEIYGKMEEYKARRLEKQPLNFPSAGSTFKRPAGNYAGKLIEEAGLRGFTMGNAQVSEKHCGFIINRGEASAAEIYTLIQEVIRRVEKNSSVALSPEVKLWGSF